MNKYEKWYASITENAKNRLLEGYTERHHIIPESLGGTDDRDNLVDLTAQEHFVCHWLLTKIHTGEARGKMIYALNGMKRTNKNQERYETPITGRVYARLKEEFSKIHSETMKGRIPPNKGIPMSEEQKEKIRATKKRNPYTPTPEQIKKQILRQTGTKKTIETKNKISNALIGKLKGPMSDSQKLAISLSSTGKKKISSHSDNVRSAVLGNISINKDGLEKKIKQDTLHIWLNQGWQLGGRKRK